MRSTLNLVLGLVAGFGLTATGHALDWKSTTVTVTTTPFQETQDVVYEFKNGGDKPVTIDDLQTSCDCVDATSDHKDYAPGSSGVIRARFTLGDRTGHYERTIMVVTSEPDSPVRLLLQVDVPATATLSPRTVGWSLNEAAAEKTIELRSAPGLEINFSEAQPTTADYLVRLEAVEPGKFYRLHVAPRGTAQAASAAVRIFGREKSGHDVVVSAYASVQ